MRNLKRALSLTLASVMLLGMMVVGAGAAGYKDVSDDHNVEAIEVLQAVGAMVGDEAGNFDPDANVNRAQIATIMSRLLDLKVEDFNAADIPFTDVPEWAVPFVAACYADGITSGISDVLYGSNNDVTAVQAALMMMKALGYFQYQEDFEQDWQLATLKKASEIGLFYGVTVDRTSPLTRNDVAQMALNALKSNMVSFTGNVGSTYPVNGETYRVGYKPEYTPQTSADAIYNRIDVGTTNIAEDDRYYVQLGEYLYGGDLRLTSDIDVFGRPARHWEFEGTDIGTYVKEELLREQYTSGVTGKTVFDLLGRSMIQDSELFVYVDGDEKETTLNAANEIDKNDLVRSNDDDLKHTGRGVLTQVFVDTRKMEITIAVINTYLAQATTAYSEKNETISLKVYSSPNGDTVKTVPLADVPEIEGLANGDWMLVYLSNMDTANNVYRVVEVMDVEILADVEIDEFSTKAVDKNDNYYNDGIDDDKDSVKTLVVGEDTYNRSYTQSYDRDVLKEYNDSALEDSTYNIYLDLYGNFIGVDLSEGTKNYVFIAGYDMNPSNITNRTAEALAIFPDGTMDNIRVDVKATNKNINNKTADENDHDDRWQEVYCEWRANSYGEIPGFTYGAKNNPLDADGDGKKDNYDGNVENLWYSYRVTDKGVYTLTPVANFTIDGWDGNPDDTERNTIRTDSVALWHQNDNHDTDGIIDHWGTGRSYGNTDSVYIVGSNDDNDFNNQVVGTVDGLYTSVDKVNITYQDPTKADTSDAGWANAVVDSDGYVVAAVILGEAEGAVDNYAYILKGAYAERYDRTTGTTYHKFDVYMNGEIKTLTTKDTYEDCVPNIKVNHVQELVLDNDGMVTRVRDIPNNKDANHWLASHDVTCIGDFAGKGDDVYDHVEAVNGTRITDYSVYYMDTDKVLNTLNGHTDYLDLYFKGDTLYMKDATVEGLDKAGLFVASDAPALLISEDDSKTEFATAKDAYSNIVDADHNRDGIQFNGHVAAALDSTGKAVWVVFYDETPTEDYTDPGYGEGISGEVVFRVGKKTIGYGENNQKLEIIDGTAKANEFGRVRIYFELDSYPNKGQINDADQEIQFVYDVYRTRNGETKRVENNVKGVLEPKDGNKLVYRFQTTLDDYFNESDKVWVEIDEVNIVSVFKVELDPDLKAAGLDAAFKTEGGDKEPGDIIAGAKPGDKITVQVGPTGKVPKAASVGAADIEVGKTYWIEFNNDKTTAKETEKADDDKVLEIKDFVLTEEIIKAGKLEVTAIYKENPNAGTPEPGVKVESVELNKATLTLEKGKNETLTATVKPANAENQKVTWESSDTAVATVDANGKVTAVAKGTATITVTTDDGGKTATCEVTVTETPSGSDTIQAAVTMSGTGELSAKIYGYLQGSPINLTAEQIAAALNNETNPLTGEKFSVSATDVKLAEKTVTVDGEALTLNNVIVTPAEALYKVTYPGGSAYLKAGVSNQKLSGVTDGIAKLIDSTKVVEEAANCLTVEKGVATVATAPTKDVTYATALPLGFDTTAAGDIQDSGSKGAVKVTYDNAGTPATLASSTGATPTHYIQSGKSLTFGHPADASTAVAANKQVKLTINGTDYIFAADKAGKLTEKSIAITGVDSTSKKVDITAVVEAAQIPVTFDGNPVQTYKVGNDWKCMITLPDGVTKLAYVKADKTLAEATLTDGQYTVDAANHAVDGKITLVSAYEVKGVGTGGDPDAKLYEKLNAAGTDVDTTKEIDDTGVLVDANATTKVYLKAEDPKTVLALKSGSKSTISKTVVAPGVTTELASKNGIWEITVGGDLDITKEVEVVAQVDATPANVKAELAADIVKDTETAPIDLDGIVIKGSWEVSGTPVIALDDALKADHKMSVTNVAVDESTGVISVKVKMTEGTTVAQPTSTTPVAVGNIIVTLTDGAANWKVVVPFTLVQS